MTAIEGALHGKALILTPQMTTPELNIMLGCVKADKGHSHEGQASPSNAVRQHLVNDRLDDPLVCYEVCSGLKLLTCSTGYLLGAACCMK